MGVRQKMQKIRTAGDNTPHGSICRRKRDLLTFKAQKDECVGEKIGTNEGLPELMDPRQIPAAALTLTAAKTKTTGPVGNRYLLLKMMFITDNFCFLKLKPAGHFSFLRS